MTYLLDVNSLIAVGLNEHEFHGRVARWVATLDASVMLATCPITELGFVRILSQLPQYRTSITQARTLLVRLKSAKSRRFVFLTDDHDAEQLPNWVKSGRQTTDGHLVALASARGATLATLDESIVDAFVIPPA